MSTKQKKTAKELIAQYCFDAYIFSTIKELESYIRDNKTPDYLALNGILYTMEEYDLEGKYISYKNKRTTNQINISTKNRYEFSFSDANAELIENYGAWRNDITFAD